MYRLHSNLRKADIDSGILCEDKTTNSPYVTVIPRLNRMEGQVKRVTSKIGLNDIHRISSFRIRRYSSYVKADIINFHGIHSGFINYLALPTLTANKTAVFTLRDMWCLTGHCVYSYDCDRWKTGCGRCPYLDEYPPIRRDATHVEWKLKAWAYKHSNLSIVAVSRWMTEIARQSMLNRFPIYHIPNGVDTKLYQPIDPQLCRAVLGIPAKKKVIMFSSLNLMDYRKGGDLLLKAIKNIPSSLKSELIILTMGSNGDRIGESLGTQSLNLGYINSHRIKAAAYSAADLFVLPTRAENLANGIMESMACGTPVVSFRVGGCPELVRPGITGCLAEPENAEDLCDCVVQLIEDKSLRTVMGKQCREIAVKEYSVELETKRYIELYRQLIAK